MSKLIDIHMNSDLTEFSSTETDGGHLTWAAAAGLPSPSATPGGMSCYIADTNNMYGLKSVTTNTSGILRARLYIDPNGLTMATNDVATIWFARSTVPNTFVSIKIFKSASSYQLFGVATDDTGTVHETTKVDITDAVHYVEVDVRRAASDVSSDGTIQVWVDGGSLQSDTGIDNYDRFNNFSYCQLGAIAPQAGTSGTFYLDELTVNDDGGEIGANPAVLTTSVDGSQAAYNNYGVKIR